MSGMMSCISLPKSREADDEADWADVSWPALVQGIRVYAVRQPPQVASDLLQWADFVDGVAAAYDLQKQR
jgi:hypothetical protein